MFQDHSDEDENQSYQNHLKITDILDSNEVQMIMLKLWYNSLLYFMRLRSSFGVKKATLINKQQSQNVRPLTPNSMQLLNVTFSNCQEFKMKKDNYYELLDRIQAAMVQFNQKQSYTAILKHLKGNKQSEVSYEMFSLQLLQMYGSTIQKINEQQTSTSLRRIFIAITTFTGKGKINIKDLSDIQSVQIKDLIGSQESQIIVQKFDEQSLGQAPKYTNTETNSSPMEYLRAQGSLPPELVLNNKHVGSFRLKKERLIAANRMKLDQNNSFSQNYSIDDVLKVRQKASISAYAYQGYDMLDYTQSINKLHKQLLKKIILNR